MNITTTLVFFKLKYCYLIRFKDGPSCRERFRLFYMRVTTANDHFMKFENVFVEVFYLSLGLAGLVGVNRHDPVLLLKLDSASQESTHKR